MITDGELMQHVIKVYMTHLYVCQSRMIRGIEISLYENVCFPSQIISKFLEVQKITNLMGVQIPKMTESEDLHKT